MKYYVHYKSFPNCPEATEYSQCSAESASHNSILLGWSVLFAAIYYLYAAFSLFSSGAWLGYIKALLCLSVVAYLSFHFFYLRPLNTDRNINLILLKHHYPSIIKQQLKEIEEQLKLEDKQKVRKEAIPFFKKTALIVLVATVIMAFWAALS